MHLTKNDIPETTQPHVIGYIRFSANEQDMAKQRLEILDYGLRNQVTIAEFVTLEMPKRKTTQARRIKEFMDVIAPGDTLVLFELLCLGRSTSEVVGLVVGLVEHNVRLIAIKQNIDLAKDSTGDIAKATLAVFASMAAMERDITSQRKETALAAMKSEGRALAGRPKGSRGKSRLDGREDEIRALLDKRVAKAAIARILDISREGLNKFMKSRHISEQKGVIRGK